MCTRDPNIGSDEIGLPMFIANKLTFSEGVTSHNFQELKQHVINGDTWPGAAAVELENGQVRVTLVIPFASV